MAHFFERDDLPGVSGKIIEENGGANYAVEYAHKLSKTVIAIKPKSENTEFNDGFKKLIANGAIEADSASQAIKIIKKGIKQRKTSLDDF